MLSTENPPPDLPYPCEISQLKSGSSDERASDNNQQQFDEVDLLKSGLDDNNPLPKFSIRDYVFNTRSKDIKNNWPFSQKNLQLCLKHGVKDVLPPFQSLDSVRNPSVVECAVENLRYSDVKQSELSDHSVREKAVDIENINTTESEEDKEFPSTTTSQSCSDINSVPPIKNPCLEPEAEYLPVSGCEKPELVVRGSNKVESNIQSPVKKCRLIVKLNNITEPKSNEDLAANTAVVSETMASKVCPVCKTFSSSSNTTLNAHIDQCLSGESTIKWTTNSKVIKHRIKPRKTRLMVDIYETALHCTLEDLDKRNGTNWASNLGLPSQDLEMCAEEEKKTYSSVNTEAINQEGAVYIDSSGTKLRILSNLPAKSNANDSGSCKFVKRDKGSKILSSKKKKFIVRKHRLHRRSLDGQGSCSPIPDNLLDCSPHGPKSCSPRPEVNNATQKLFPTESYKEDDPTQPLIASDQMKPDDFGMIKQWVGSKRTGLKKKVHREHENQHLDKSIKNLRVKSMSSLGDTIARGNTAALSPISSDENPLLHTGSHKRKEDLFCNSHDGCTDLPCQRKRPGFPLLKSQDLSGKKNHLTLSKSNVKQSRKDSPLVHEHHMDPPNGTENHASSRSNKKIGMSSSPTVKNDRSFIGSSMSQHHIFSSEGKEFASLRKTSLGHAIPSGSKKFSSLRTKLLSVRHASVTESKKNLGRKLSNFKNSRLCCTSRSDEEAVVSRSAPHQQNNLVETLGENATQLEKDFGKQLINRPRVLKIRKKVSGFVNTGDGDMTSKSLGTSTESDSHSVEKNIDYLTGGSVPFDTSNVLEEEAEMLDEYVCGTTYKITDGETFVSFSKSLDSAFPGLAGSSNVECVSQYYSKAFDGHRPTELVLGSDQEIFSPHEVGKNLVTPDSHVAEMDADEAQGNYFVDVDPIPIPGPPGSFLPSPGRMGSEELQGHSSLTTCRIQSSEDGHEVVDMDSSDSPISAVSAVSNSVAGRSNSTSIVNLSEQSNFQHDTQCDISEDRSDPVIEGSSPFEQAASGERELNLLESRANLMLPEVTRDVQNFQPCCCSRKDGSLQGGSLNYQESQLLRRRTMTSLSVRPQEKQVSDNLKNEIRCFNLRSETPSEKEPTPETAKDAANSPMGYAPVQVSHNSEAVFPACGDCESPSPSTSNPVLRLMGKNLMVVNKDDHPSPQTRPTQSSMVMDHPGMRLCVENGLSTSNNLNEPNSFHHILSRGPSMFDNMQPRLPAQHFDFNSSDGFKVPANYGPQQLSANPSTAMFSGMNFGGSVTSASRYHEYPGGFNLIPEQLGSKIRLDTRTAYDAEKVRTPVHHLKSADSSGGKHKEIIIIDDSPESEAGLAVKSTHCEVNMEVGGSVRSAAPMALHCDSRGVNPFYSYQTRVYPRFTGSPVVPNGNSLVPPSKGMNANLGKWNCIPENSNVLHPNSSTASLPSTVKMRSSVYFSPGFS